jgi:hypothetical protein
MTTLRRSKKHLPALFRTDRTAATLSDQYHPNSPDTMEFSRFKSQLKRAVDSVEAPQYLIDAIKNAIRS